MNSTGELGVELIEQRSQLPLSAARWNELVAQNETNTVFQTFEWFDAWWQNFGGEHQLFFLVVRKGGDIVGFAALMLRRTALGLPRLEFTGTGNADYQDFVLPTDKAATLGAICGFLRANASRWHRAWLCNIPSHSSTPRLLSSEGGAAGLYFVHEARVPCPTLLLENDPGIAQQLIGKYSMRRPFNWFAKRGEVRFRHVTSLQEIELLLPKFFDQHIRRWRAVGRRSLFEQSRQQAFYRSLVHAMHGPGPLLFSVVEFNGEPISFHFGFDYARSVIWYKPSFEIRYGEHSPGLLLIRQLIEDSLQRRRREIDFTIGDEEFKGRFANLQRDNLYIGAYHSRWGYLYALALRQVIGMLGGLRRRFRTRTALRLQAPEQKAQPDTRTCR